MKMVRVHNVKNVVTGATGNLIIVANQYSMKKFLDNNPCGSEKDYPNSSKGMSFFFEEEGKKPECILTYVITGNEFELLKEGRIDCIRDVSFLLTLQNSYIMMVKMYLDNVKQEDHMYGTFSSKICNLELNVPNEYWSTTLKEECENHKYGACGFRLALARACENVNISDDLLISNIRYVSEDIKYLNLYTIAK